MRSTLTVLAATLLLTACATAERMTASERLELYRANAGEPVRSISVTGRLWGWRSLGDSALTVWTRNDQGFLLELVSRCPEMQFASSIVLTTRTGRVAAGFDNVVIQRSSAQGGRTTCRIGTIRPLNTQVVKEARRDLQDVGLVEHDPAAPDPSN